MNKIRAILVFKTDHKWLSKRQLLRQRTGQANLFQPSCTFSDKVHLSLLLLPFCQTLDKLTFSIVFVNFSSNLVAKMFQLSDIFDSSYPYTFVAN